MTSGIYLIFNRKNNKKYMGSSANIEKRWREHKRSAAKGTHANAHFQAAWNKHGAEAFLFEVLCCCGESKLLEMEQLFLDTYKPEYNMACDAVAPMRGRVRIVAMRGKASSLLEIYQ